jgi:predicted nuclease of restriction endonuclease-like (RecB) superfamily
LLYWDIGGKIVDNQKKYGWGKAIVETLAKDLQTEFPGVAGYSADNLWRMRKFYLNYANKPKLAPLVQEIAWAHNIIIMEKCKNDLAREFYVRMAIKYG